jgi:uncharacterized protein (TIGR03382 family)
MMQGDRKRLLSAQVFFVAVLLCPQLKANSIYPDCVSGSLQSYMSSSDCVLGGSSGGVVVFGGFAFPAPLNPDGATVLDASQIELTPVPSGLGGSFDFSRDFSVPTGDTVTYDIDYFLLLDPASVLGGGSLALDPSGNVSVTESICADSFFGTDSGGATVCQANSPGGVVDSAPQSLSVNDSNPPYSLSAQIALNPAAYNFASVEIEIVLTGGVTGASSGGVVVTNTVDASSPEPVTSLLCLGGLIAIGLFRRRFIV